MKKVLFFTLLIGCCFCFPALGAEYYIDAQNGNDADAGTEAAPWQSLAKINSVSGGDTVFLKGDFFALGGTLTLVPSISGTVADPTIIMNWPGTSPAIQVLASGFTLQINANNLEMHGLNFNNNGTLQAVGGSINISQNVQNVIINDCIFQDGRYGVASQGTVGNLVGGLNISNNDFINNRSAIYLTYAENVEISSNYLYNNPASGIINTGGNTHNIFNNVVINSGEVAIGAANITNFRVINNTTSNALFGIFITGSDGLVAKNNIISSMTYAGVGHTSTTNVAFDYNLFSNNANIGNVGGGSGTYYNSLPDWQAQGFDEHSFNGDPQFLSTTTGSENFDIDENSDAIDTGIDASNFTTVDYNDAPRPQGTAYDVGAYEYKTVPSLSVISTKPKKIQLDWDDTCSVCTYNLVRASDDAFTTPDTYVNIGNSELLIENLKPAKKYFWKITSNNGVTESDNSDVLFAPTIPKKVKKLKITDNITENAAKIRWKKYKRVKNYSIKLMSSSGKKIKVIKIKRKKKFVKNTKKKYVKTNITGLKSGKKYRVKVRARRKMEGAWYKGRWSKRKKFYTQ